MPIYSAGVTTVAENGQIIASTRGGAAECQQRAAMIAMALNSFSPDTVRAMHCQLRMIRTAILKSREAIGAALELLPQEAPQASKCTAADAELTEALFFIDQVTSALPVILPAAHGGLEALAAVWRSNEPDPSIDMVRRSSAMGSVGRGLADNLRGDAGLGSREQSFMVPERLDMATGQVIAPAATIHGLTLTSRQHVWLECAAEFVWHNEGDDSDNTPPLSEAEYQDLAQQLKGTAS